MEENGHRRQEHAEDGLNDLLGCPHAIIEMPFGTDLWHIRQISIATAFLTIQAKLWHRTQLGNAGYRLDLPTFFN
jgi:hypothetical protein